MGRALAELLEQVDEAKRSADGYAPLLDEAATELPPEADVRALLESAEVDVDAAVAAARADGDLFEGDELPADPLPVQSPMLLEAIGAGTEKGTRRYKAVVIRPGRGKGPGRRYYGQKMLEANAGNFGGVTCFFNHEPLSVIMARGHGSRDPRDVCGWLQDGTWWDPQYTHPDDKKNGHEQGAVMGHTDMLVEAADRVDALPQAFSLSVCMDPTRVRLGRTPNGDLAPLVEGVVPKSGSLDLITGEAGAGGKLLERLREAAQTRYGSAHVDLDTIGDEQLVEAARARPGVLAALREDPAPPKPEDDVSDALDLSKLVESAQADPGTLAALGELLAGTPAMTTLVEARVAAREDDIRADARAESDRALLLRDMRDEAHRIVEAAAVPNGGILTPAYVDDLRERYVLRNGSPSAALDVYDELDESGAVKKPALERLREAVEADIEREQAKIRESAPTRVRQLAAPAGNGDGNENGDGDGKGDPPPPDDPMAKRLGQDPAEVAAFRSVRP